VGEAQVNGDAAALLLRQAVASIPVKAFTNAVLPWSICPAVPTTIDFIWLASYRNFPPKMLENGPTQPPR
jgi:hypothetical protein